MMEKHLRLTLSLQEEPFFRSMSSDARGRFETFVYHREYEPRQVIYFPDDACDHVYWVREGMVKVTRVSPDRRELTFRLLFPGDILGEECLAKKLKYGSYAEAMRPTILCLMRSDDFRRLAKEDAEVSFAVAERLCQRVTEVENVLAETVFNTVRSRIASALLRLHQRAPEGKRNIAITHQEIANLVGSTRETTTAQLHAFKKEGILEIGNRRITILDAVQLERAARSG